MEAMALIAAQLAMSDNPFVDISVVSKANVAAEWIDHHTTVSEMQYFKGKRQILLKQSDSAFRGRARDYRGHFRSKRVANADANTGDSSSVLRPTQVSKKLKWMLSIETYFAQCLVVD